MNQKLKNALALATVSVMTAPAFAAGEIDALLNDVDISGVAAKVASLGLAIVGVAFAIKGISVAKRIVSKI